MDFCYLYDISNVQLLLCAIKPIFFWFYFNIYIDYW